MWPDLHFHSLPERSFAPAPFELMHACGLEQAMCMYATMNSATCMRGWATAGTGMYATMDFCNRAFFPFDRRGPVLTKVKITKRGRS